VSSSQHVIPNHILPVVAKAKGQLGTDWVSDVSVSNVSSSPVTVQISFFPEKTDNPFPSPFMYQTVLGPDETRVFADVIGTLFPTAGDNIKGGLLIMGRSNQPGQAAGLAVISRTYNNADPNRTYGQTVPSANYAMVWGAGKAVLPGVRQDSRFRTNVGVANLSMGPGAPPRLRVKVRILGPTGSPIRELTREIKGLSLEQWSLTELGVTSLAAGRVEVSIDPTDTLYQPCQVRTDPGQPGALFIAYSSKVDNATGDGEFGLGLVDWSAYATCPEPPGGDPCR
ncbi:MAG: hypothetical protein NZ869_10170, partial [Thermoanaerobaculum sp.]|nr:hypothetical protein [Thermoanaerobaculum sp.]MDW7968453.1 hypothetical protein [Thermoanaerobaculum sp.]